MIQQIAEVLQKKRQPTQNTDAVRCWWGPIWRGLPVEPTARHYKAMGKAVWLYIYFVIHANRKTGVLYRLVPAIAQDMGLSVRTIQYWLTKLRKTGYVKITSTGRGLEISVLKWKPLGRGRHR